MWDVEIPPSAIAANGCFIGVFAGDSRELRMILREDQRTIAQVVAWALPAFVEMYAAAVGDSITYRKLLLYLPRRTGRTSRRRRE